MVLDDVKCLCNLYGSKEHYINKCILNLEVHKKVCKQVEPTSGTGARSVFWFIYVNFDLFVQLQERANNRETQVKRPIYCLTSDVCIVFGFVQTSSFLG